MSKKGIECKFSKCILSFYTQRKNLNIIWEFKIRSRSPKIIKCKLSKCVFTPSSTAVFRRGIVIAMSVHPSSVHCPHFQLSLVARVSVGFILYWSPVREIEYFGSRCRPSWIQNGRHPNYKKKRIFSSFFKSVLYFYMNCIPLCFRGQWPIYELNVGHLEFKMADAQTVKKCNLPIFKNFLQSLIWILFCWISDIRGQYLGQMSVILDSKWPTFK